MNRIRRWIFNVAVGLSLVLCVVTIALWSRSYRFFDDAVYVKPRTTTNIVSLRGRIYLQFGWWRDERLASGRYAAGGWFVDTLGARQVGYPLESHDLRFLGFGASTYINRDTNGQIASREHVLIIPYWFPLALSLILPALAWLRGRRHRIEKFRRDNGLCIKCGYDLRASPYRCPECGAIPQPAPATNPRMRC